MRAAIFFVLCLTPVQAVACEIDNWRYSVEPKFNRADVQGTATCQTGKIVIRAFDNAGNWIGNIIARIDGYSFAGSIWGDGPIPPKMKIKYIIEP